MTLTAMLRSGRSLGLSTRYARPTRRITTAATSSESSFHHEPQPPPVQPQIESSNRRKTLKEAKPFSEFLTDNFNRQHDYLRISVTERCNLRCLYCMPEEGVPLSPPAHLLTTPEIFYLSSLFVSQGVTKIRLTGGEPTVRSDILPLMQQIGSLKAKGLRELALTTNGISLHRKLDKMVEAGLTGVNISLDTLDPFQFQLLTRRKGFDAVMKSINRVLEMNKLGAGVKLKVNCVVMRGINEREIIPFVEMGREKDIEVRFIEYMPFGGNKWSERKMLTYQEMLDMIREKYPGLRKVQGHRNDTSKTFEIPGFVGKMGFITSMTHNFCGTCNRLRITGDGNLKVCLHGNTEVSLRDLIRQDNDGRPIDQEAFEALKELEINRHQGLPMSDQKPSWSQREQELLEVIGVAVKRKKEKHAGMEELQNMENRPMILIAEGNNRARTPRTFGGHNGVRSPWSTIPLHLLQPNAPGSIGARTYSTSSQAASITDKDDDSTDGHLKPVQNDSIMSSESMEPATLPENSDKSAPEPTQSASQPDSTLGFQSLRGLFSGISSSLSSSTSERLPLEEKVPSRTMGSSNETAVSGESTTESSLQARTEPERSEMNMLEEQVDPRHVPAISIEKRVDTTEYKAPNPVSIVEKDSARSLPSELDSKPAERPNQAKAQPQELEMDIFEEQNEPIRASPSPVLEAKQESNSVDRGSSDSTSVTTRRARSQRSKSSDNNNTRPLIRTFQSDQTQGAYKRWPPQPPGPSPLPPWSIAQNPSSNVKDATGTSSRKEKSMQRATRGNASPAPAPVSRNDPASTTGVPLESQPAAAPVLTHLTSSGEAHMVDVGKKASTSRVAIAFSAIRFSNGDPYKLITENSNKKGDVLGVARIAGLMAAKRCAEIIPLCHPIPITKVQVDLDLHPGTGSDKLWDNNLKLLNRHGLVIIEARVHCDGKTGVEMEALTAASAAALTVYDMCKAVDKAMVIVNTRLAFKDGGKEPFVWARWRSYKDNQEMKKKSRVQGVDEVKGP